MAGHVRLQANVSQVGGVPSIYNFRIFATDDAGFTLLDVTTLPFSIAPGAPPLAIDTTPSQDLGVVIGTHVSVVAFINRVSPNPQNNVAPAITGSGNVPGAILSVLGSVQVVAAHVPSGARLFVSRA